MGTSITCVNESYNQENLYQTLMQNIKDNSHKNFKRTDTMQSDIYIDKGLFSI